MTKDGIVYLTIADKNYDKKLAHIFLIELSELFLDEIRNTYGTSPNIDYLSKVETIENQYAFLKFGKSKLIELGFNRQIISEKTINRKKKEFRDMNAQENI